MGRSEGGDMSLRRTRRAPEDRKQRFNLSLTRSVHDAADRAAFMQGKAFSRVVEGLLIRWLDEGATVPLPTVEDEVRPTAAAIYRAMSRRS